MGFNNQALKSKYRKVFDLDTYQKSRMTELVVGNRKNSATVHREKDQLVKTGTGRAEGVSCYRVESLNTIYDDMKSKGWVPEDEQFEGRE